MRPKGPVRIVSSSLALSALPRWLVAVALLLHVLPFAVRPALIGGDEPHYALTAHSIATDLDLALDDDYDAVESGSSAAGGKFAGKKLDRHILEREGTRSFSENPMTILQF